MIKKLRRQFIIVIMAVVTVLIAAAFIAVLTITSTSLSREANFALKDAVMKANTPGGGMGFGGDMRRLPTITVITDNNGVVVFVRNYYFNIGSDDIAAITSKAFATGASKGLLREYNLQFVIATTPEGQTIVAFVDVSMEKSIIGSLLLDSALIGGATLLLFFGVSIILSRWVVRPVEKAWNSQRQFVADASHELKTPLTVVLSNAEMLCDETVTDGAPAQDGKTQTRLENIREEARRMRALVDDLLSLARSDIVGSKKIYEKVDLSALVHNALLNFEPVFFDAGMRLDDTVEDGLAVRGDNARLCQLVEILLDNAAKYTRPGGHINVRLTTSGKSEIQLEVANESETIPKEELQHIFQRFYRLDKARSGGGYGLGLAIADSIAKEHNGRIWAKSENGLTAFFVTLPVVRS